MSVYAAGDSVDEIHYAYGESNGSVVFNWRGQEQNIYYGSTTDYGDQAVAGNSAVTPVDIAGPFREVALTGLQPNSTYHYKIGVAGLDHTFKTMPTGNFKWVDMGDTGGTDCKPWVAGTHSLASAQSPDFVTHGGDISYANECGVPSVHQYYLDQEVWSQSAAFQPVWGNHEYGAPNAESPAGTPRDTLANYKGRSYITNAQTVPNDTATKISNPGCGEETGSSTNTCQGEDWGWFTTGKVLFIAYPEPWYNALPNWQTKADALMAQAQADPNIDFIVTYGHRPAYSSVSSAISTAVRDAITPLAQKYSPTTTNTTGKYVLNVGHHAHGGEIFAPIDGLIHITNGGGGTGQVTYDTPAAGSVFTTRHPEILSTTYDEAQHSLTVNMLCGPEYTPNPKDICTYGSTLYSKTFTNTPPAPIPTTTEWIGNTSVETDLTGWAGKYGSATLSSTTRDTTVFHSGVASIKLTALTGASNSSLGFNDNPRWVTNTTTGTTYTQSAWVKPTFVGQKLTLRLREWQGPTLMTDKYVSITAATTDWQQISQTLTAAGSGNQLSFAIYASGMNAGHAFYADDFSLTTPL